MKYNEHDQRTHSDLKHERWSGIRTNEILMRFEIWIAGEIAKTVSYGEFFDDPDSLNTAYCLAFGLKSASLQGAVTEALKEITGRKERIQQLNQTDAGKRLLDKLH